MPYINFIQNFPPNPDTVEIQIDRPDDVAAKAQIIQSHDFRLECEVLGSGDISFFIADARCITYAMRISKPGSGTLPQSVDTLILDFDVGKAVRQRAVLNAAGPLKKSASH